MWGAGSQDVKLELLKSRHGRLLPMDTPRHQLQVEELRMLQARRPDDWKVCEIYHNTTFRV